MAGCNKCTGSCACKAKKPRAKKAPAKRVIGGRVKAPQVVIIGDQKPLQNPYQTVVTTSMPGVNLKPEVKGISPDKRLMELRQDLSRRNELTKLAKTGSQNSWTRELGERRDIKAEIKSILAGNEPSTKKLTNAEKMGISEERAKKQHEEALEYQTDFFERILPEYKEKAKGKKITVAPVATQTSAPPVSIATQTSAPPVIETQIETPRRSNMSSLREYLSMPSPSLVQEALKFSVRPKEKVTTGTQTEKEKRRRPYDAGFMSILPQAIRLENVRQRAIGEKPSMTTMETQTEPLEVKVSKGQKQSVFEFMKQQELTGKTAALTGAGRPFRENVEMAMAAAVPSETPTPAVMAAGAPAPFEPVLSSRQRSLREFFRSAPREEESPE
jgi:hypothetical protein